MYHLTKTETALNHKLWIVRGPWCFFSRMRILAGGHILDDIAKYNRVHEMFNRLSGAECLGNRARSNIITDANAKGIPPTESMAVLCKPLS